MIQQYFNLLSENFWVICVILNYCCEYNKANYSINSLDTVTTSWFWLSFVFSMHIHCYLREDIFLIESKTTD
jgi:hypothetical protein